jgi:hypothetical protein
MVAARSIGVEGRPMSIVSAMAATSDKRGLGIAAFEFGR